MAIIYDPKRMAKKIAPEKKIKRLLNRKEVTLKKAALSFVDSVDFIDKSAVSRVALKTIKGYSERIEKVSEDYDDKEARIEKRVIVASPKQLIQRVQNEIIFQVALEIKDKYKGEFYEWLPSDAAEPDPEHQLKYGKVFQVGVGEMPGDRYGCKCGMRILVDEDELKLA